jgi:hypothetical protein
MIPWNDRLTIEMQYRTDDTVMRLLAELAEQEAEVKRLVDKMACCDCCES